MYIVEEVGALFGFGFEFLLLIPALCSHACVFVYFSFFKRMIVDLLFLLIDESIEYFQMGYSFEKYYKFILYYYLFTI